MLGRTSSAASRRLGRSFSSQAGLYLGLDSSTQGLKATAINHNGQPVAQAAVNYDRDLPQYGTSGGCIKGQDDEVTAPSLMFADALDLLLARFREDKFDFKQVQAVSGSGQQHGSVFWKQGAATKLASLIPAKSIADQVSDAFSIQNGPIWMDSSTTEQCDLLEELLGGAQATADLTGSRAYERFTGNQIAKRIDLPEMQQTERISLVSSFMCSLLLGGYAGIDHSDAGGMNLMNLHTKAWDQRILSSLGNSMEQKLGAPIPSHSVVGDIHPYYVQKFGFDPECKLVAWSGDNPCSVAGLGLGSGEVALSMGTSDTLFGITSSPKPATEGHVFVSPVDPDEFMAMLCFKNGSLNRERIKNQVCNSGDWEAFNQLLSSTPAGNDGNIGFYMGETEITPPLRKGDYRFKPDDSPASKFSAATEARAVVEGMALSLKYHSQSIGITSPSRVIATGGASANIEILQVVADVFGAPVYTAESTDSASLGAALRAHHGFLCHGGDFVPFHQVHSQEGLTLTAKPTNGVTEGVYSPLIERYAALEASLLH